ncbi:HD domain-containing protein [Litoribrevibacter euphylliae]|uniref:HD domain-containing protein n=1 Tax=Litoribrevibacter euphylliae TaxID=1834034 RepID=A0ABV7HIM6_9GAMM
MLNSIQDAYSLLDKLNAPEHLKIHVRLVGEAADLIIDTLQGLGFLLDFEFIRIGVAIHDIGKIIHTNEMIGPGSEHEPEGEQMLLELGVDARIARCCLSHARFDSMNCSIEELLIALSDKLWKGKRVESLELKVIDTLAQIKGTDRWDLFADLDACFENIAAGGHDRLQRSINS